MTASRLLVVEDEPAIAELIAINLRHAGFTVHHAVTAEAAREAVDRELPGLVVLDWMLPDRSGIALCRQWRGESRTRDLPVIMGCVLFLSVVFVVLQALVDAAYGFLDPRANRTFTA